MDINLLIGFGVAALSALLAFLKLRDMEKKDQLHSLRESVFQLFLLAEKKEWIGTEKLDFVVQTVYVRFPIQVKLFIGESMVKDWVQKLYDECKDFLDDGEVNQSHK